jgi:hypothetical protein
LSFKSILNRSDQLQNDLVTLFDLDFDESSERYHCCRIICSVAIEHAESLRHLLRKNLPTSAISLLRIQFETFVRAAWVLHAASESHINSIMDTDALLDEKKANSLPMLSEMINALEGKAPDSAVEMIKVFKTSSWRYLCSHIHGGYYAVQLHGRGVPPKHASEVLLMSNVLLTWTGIILCTLSLNQNGLIVLREINNNYKNCLPRFIE